MVGDYAVPDKQLLGRRAFASLAIAAILTRPALAKKPKAATIDDDASITHMEGIVQKVLNQSCGCNTICLNTASEVIIAANLWLQTMEKRGDTVPGYINDAYATRSAGIEGVMHLDSYRPGSEYSGLMQFARLDHTKTFWRVAPMMVDYFNDGDIRKQVMLKPDGSKIVANDFEKEDIFLNPHVQVAALMFVAFDISKDIENSPLKALPTEYKQAWLYLFHNLPHMAWVVRDNLGKFCAISKLVPKRFKKYYGPNSGIYGRNGNVTPLGVLIRIEQLTRIFFDRFHPDGSQFSPFIPSPPNNNIPRPSVIALQ